MDNQNDNETPTTKALPSSPGYAISLQRAIEHHCRGVQVPEGIAEGCPYHAKMLNNKMIGGAKIDQTEEPEAVKAKPMSPDACARVRVNMEMGAYQASFA